MHKDLEIAFNKAVNILKEDTRCRGGWHFGSVGRGTSDIYSDYDPIFLIANKDFDDFSKDIPKILTNVSDELIIYWEEDFNNEHFRNYCSLIRIGENLHQFDFFILNSDYPEDRMCKQHIKGCTSDNIIFDSHGEVAALLNKGLKTENYIPDPVRVMDTYWFHAEMLIKYFKRNDIFKLLKNIDILFHTHVDLLLFQYDSLDYGSWETKVNHCVPMDKQAHLKLYFSKADLKGLEKTIKAALVTFKQDAEDLCKSKGLNYSSRISSQVISYFNKRMSDVHW